MIEQKPFNTPTIKPVLARISVNAIPDGGAISLDLSFQAGRERVILTRRDDRVAAFLNRCPHARWPLDTFDGRFLFTPEGALICAAHNAVFDPISGAYLGGPGQGEGLISVPMTRQGNDVVFE
jgi:nitrite reductase/ring-hydroxylating ferredoxin subunit